jgi:hypothetical protein
MIFLIEYTRREGRIVSLKKFDDDDANLAANTRLELELDLNRRGIEREVVLFEAANEDALRRTHRRYFETLTQLAS